MPEITIAEILARARGRSPVVPLDSQEAGRVNEATVDQAVEPAVEQPQQAAAVGQVPDQAAPATPMPTGPSLSLAERARQLPRDAARWEVLLNNAWMTDPWWFWTLATLRLGGCQIVPHKEAGWALRYDAAAVDELRRKTGDGMLFGSEAEYRALAARALAPRREELTELLQLSSFGRLVDEDFGWAFSPAGKRRDQRTRIGQGDAGRHRIPVEPEHTGMKGVDKDVR